MVRRVFIGLVINLGSLVVARGLDASASEPPAPFKVIVNASVAGQALTREVLLQIYLGKVERWGDRSVIAAVDLSSTSTVRQAFSEQALGMPVEAVQHLWMRKIADGKRPPISKPSDEEVIAFVAAERGGIGYVSTAAHVPATVRELSVQP
jgi:ABC-type phosphate transport system substrate-binding protein